MASTAEHRDRVRAAMADAGIDVVLLGREANARYVTGANRLWLAGTRPFAPGCVLVAETGAVGLLSVTDDGVPDDVPRSGLYPISWNPMNLVAGAAAVARGATVRRVGVDSMSPLFAQLLAGGFPDAELVDGEALLRRVRRTKSDADVAGIRAAGAVAEEMLGAVLDGAGDATERAARAEERRAARGVTTPAFPSVVDVEDGRVAARVGVIRDGWLGVLARTSPGGGPAKERVDAAAARCRPGTPVGAVRADGVSVEGVGLGHEALRDDDLLEAGMVVSVDAASDGTRWGDPLLVTDAGAERLARA
ncbi:MAG TPA: aminopeptidase P family N-terminal domain-containing protein [Acidimicrobiia bacterium]